MATKAVTLKNENGDTIYPVTDVSLVNGGIFADTIAPVEAGEQVTTNMIADGAVTAPKIDFSTLRSTLWTNSNPTSSFASTTFTISGLSDWDYIAVIARTHTSQNQMNMFKVEYDNGGIEINFADNSNTMDRAITWSGDSVTITGGRLNASSANDRCVPIKIIGMKY